MASPRSSSRTAARSTDPGEGDLSADAVPAGGGAGEGARLVALRSEVRRLRRELNRARSAEEEDTKRTTDQGATGGAAAPNLRGGHTALEKERRKAQQAAAAFEEERGLLRGQLEQLESALAESRSEAESLRSAARLDTPAGGSAGGGSDGSDDSNGPSSGPGSGRTLARSGSMQAGHVEPVAALQEQLATLRQAHDAACKAHATRASELPAPRRGDSAMRGAWQAFRARITELESHVASLDALSERTTDSLCNLHEAFLKSQEERAAKHALQVQSLRRENREMEARLARAEAARAELTAQRTSLDGALREAVAEREARIRQLQEAAAAQKKVIKDAKRQARKAEQRSKAYEQRLADERSDFESAVEQMRMERDAVLEEAHTHRIAAEEREATLGKHLSELTAALERSPGDAAGSDELRELRLGIKERDEDIHRLEKRLEELDVSKQSALASLRQSFEDEVRSVREMGEQRLFDQRREMLAEMPSGDAQAKLEELRVVNAMEKARMQDELDAAYGKRDRTIDKLRAERRERIELVKRHKKQLAELREDCEREVEDAQAQLEIVEASQEDLVRSMNVQVKTLQDQVTSLQSQLADGARSTSDAREQSPEELLRLERELAQAKANNAVAMSSQLTTHVKQLSEAKRRSSDEQAALRQQLQESLSGLQQRLTAEESARQQFELRGVVLEGELVNTKLQLSRVLPLLDDITDVALALREQQQRVLGRMAIGDGVALLDHARHLLENGDITREEFTQILINDCRANHLDKRRPSERDFVPLSPRKERGVVEPSALVPYAGIATPKSSSDEEQVPGEPPSGTHRAHK